jgi:predicted RNase H-like nuclease (RuvC/YqgF family)
VNEVHASATEPAVKATEPKGKEKETVTSNSNNGPLIHGFDVTKAVKEIRELKRTIYKLVDDKQQLQADIAALRDEIAELEAK